MRIRSGHIVMATLMATGLPVRALDRVTVSTAVTDLAGNRLDQSTRKGLQPKRWTFTTS